MGVTRCHDRILEPASFGKKTHHEHHICSPCLCRSARTGGMGLDRRRRSPAGSLAWPCGSAVQRPAARGRNGPARDRDARPGGGRRDRTRHGARDPAARRCAARASLHDRHRRKPRPGYGDLHHRAKRVRFVDLDPGAGQFLHQRACGRRTQRRQALCGQDLREGLGRLLGARQQECGRRPRLVSDSCACGNSRGSRTPARTSCARRSL